jgi:hypothetical protein
MVFDVKFDLRRKARLVAGQNHTDPPRKYIYSRVVDIQMVGLGFMLTAQMTYQYALQILVMRFFTEKP